MISAKRIAERKRAEELKSRRSNPIEDLGSVILNAKKEVIVKDLKSGKYNHCKLKLNSVLKSNTERLKG